MIPSDKKKSPGEKSTDQSQPPPSIFSLNSPRATSTPDAKYTSLMDMLAGIPKTESRSELSALVHIMPSS